MPSKLPYFQTTFSLGEFSERRERILKAIGPDAVALIQGAPNPQGSEVFRQTNEMFYLCGVEVPHAYLLIDGRTQRSTLYLPHRDEAAERSEGALFNADNPLVAINLIGVENVRALEALSSDLSGAQTLYTPFSPAETGRASRDSLLHAQATATSDPWTHRPSREAAFRTLLAEHCAPGRFADLTPILDRLRIIKSPAEVQAMRAAGRITALAVTEAMHATRPGMLESHLAAIAEFVFQANGSRPGGAYASIIAAGKNIWHPHYNRNHCELLDGDWVLMDHAPDLNYYTSDIGRLWPVNGRFNAEQRELYDFVLRYHRELLAQTRPGLTVDSIHASVAEKMSSEIQRRKWSNSSFETAARNMLKFKGHLSHGVGMAVHDAGKYQNDILRPGTVFAVDPQMWVRDMELYVRVEDTVVVTEDGIEVLTAGAPLDIDDIEAAIDGKSLFSDLQRETLGTQEPLLCPSHALRTWRAALEA